MLKLALAATATVAAGTVIYYANHHDDHARTSAATAHRPQARPTLRLGEGKHGLAHALALGPSAAPREIPSRSVAESDLALLPADADAVIGVDFAQIQKSALWQRYVAKQVAEAKDLRELIEECGFDPMVSLGHITIGLKGLGEGDTTTGSVVIHGFDKTKAMACFNNRALPEIEKAGPHVTVDNGVVLIDSPDDASHAGFTFVDDTTALLVFGPQATTRQGILDVAAGTHGLRDAPVFADALQNVNTDASLWVVLSDASPIISSANGAIASFTSQKLGTAYMSLDVSDSLAFDAGVHLGSAANVAAALATITTDIDAVDPNKSLRSYFDQLDVFADGSDLIVSVSIAGDQLPFLGAAIAMQSAITASAQ